MMPAREKSWHHETSAMVGTHLKPYSLSATSHLISYQLPTCHQQVAARQQNFRAKQLLKPIARTETDCDQS